MKDLKRLLNSLAKELDFTIAQSQLAKASYDCSIMNDILNDLAGSGIPGYETRRLTAFSEIDRRINDIKTKADDVCVEGLYFFGMHKLIEEIIVLIEESLCILNWLGGFQGVVLRTSLEALKGIMNHLRKMSHLSSLFKSASDALCTSVMQEIITIDGLDILEELGIDEGPTTFQLQPTPTTCPEGVVDGIINTLPPSPLLDEVETIRLILSTLAIAAAAALAVLAAAIAAGVPAAVATAVYNATILSAKGIAIAALVLLGFTEKTAADTADGVADGVENCELDTTPTDIGVEEEIKGEGCCLNGEILEGVTQMGCEGIEGAEWGDLVQMGCMVVE